MRRQHTGRPGTPVIGDSWADAHRAAATATHTAGCAVRHPGGTRGPIDTTTGARAITANAPHYTGPCTVTSEAAVTEPEAGEETIPTSVYVVAFDWDAATAARVGDIVTVTSPGPNGDPTLTGLDLVIDSIAHEYLAWERVFRCSLDQS